jgi:hypothetical protein
VIFNTTDSNEGWNGIGQMNGLKSEGVYVYFLSIKDRENKEYQFRGTVTMLIDEN